MTQTATRPRSATANAAGLQPWETVHLHAPSDGRPVHVVHTGGPATGMRPLRDSQGRVRICFTDTVTAPGSLDAQYDWARETDLIPSAIYGGGGRCDAPCCLRTARS